MSLIIRVIVLTIIFTIVFKKMFNDMPNVYTYMCFIISVGCILMGVNNYIEESQSSYPFYGLALMLIGGGALMMIYIVYELNRQYKIEKNTAETIERYVTGIVKSKNSKTNIRTVNNRVQSSEEDHTVIKLEEPDSYDNFINFYDYNTFMTVSEGEKVNLKNIRKLDKDRNILESTFWIV